MRRRYPRPVTVYVSDEQYRAILEAAQADMRTVTSFIRAALVKTINKEEK